MEVVMDKIERGYTPRQVATEIDNARFMCQILMAHGDGGMKRKLGMMGEYGKHRDNAAKAMIDNAFAVCVGLDVIKNPGIPFISGILWRRFKKRQKELSAGLDAIYGSEEAAIPAPVETRAAKKAPLAVVSEVDQAEGQMQV